MAEKFDKFMDMIQKEAAKTGKCFFISSGEGHDFENEEIECEDLFGWLIPIERKKEFISDNISKEFSLDKWEDFEIFVVWSFDENNNIKIEFKEF